MKRQENRCVVQTINDIKQAAYNYINTTLSSSMKFALSPKHFLWNGKVSNNFMEIHCNVTADGVSRDWEIYVKHIKAKLKSKRNNVMKQMELVFLTRTNLFLCIVLLWFCLRGVSFFSLFFVSLLFCFLLVKRKKRRLL